MKLRPKRIGTYISKYIRFSFFTFHSIYLPSTLWKQAPPNYTRSRAHLPSWFSSWLVQPGGLEKQPNFTDIYWSGPHRHRHHHHRTQLRRIFSQPKIVYALCTSPESILEFSKKKKNFSFRIIVPVIISMAFYPWNDFFLQVLFPPATSHLRLFNTFFLWHSLRATISEKPHLAVESLPHAFFHSGFLHCTTSAVHRAEWVVPPPWRKKYKRENWENAYDRRGAK